MPTKATLLPDLVATVVQAIAANEHELTELDQAIGDGDHVSNLQRGLQALTGQGDALKQLDWKNAFQKMGMTVMSSIGGASGSLYGTLFMALGKNWESEEMTLDSFADAFAKAVEAVKQRGKADKGEKTMLDVLIPVAECLQNNRANPDVLTQVKTTAIAGRKQPATWWQPKAALPSWANVHLAISMPEQKAAK